MSKRSPDQSLSEEMNVAKKQKITGTANEADAAPALGPENESLEADENPVATQPETVTVEVDEIVAPSTNKAAKTTKKTTNKVTNPKAKPKVVKPTLKPPVGDGFSEYAYDATVPEPNEFWGVKPLPGDRRPHPDQPSARESNGQTNPPMWEERGYRYKRGSRHVKYFGPIAPDNVDSLEPTLDQEELLVVKVIDMRPKSNKDQSPKRTPAIYCYGKVPRDWDNMQAIKALNDRRYQSIDRMTMDAPWTRIEREYLASLLAENPDASIWELTELHNDRFMNKDFATETGFGFANLSVGRTVESVRYEYCTYKPFYDKGEAPKMIRWRGDPSIEARNIKKDGRFEKFGPPSRMLQMAYDAAHTGEDESGDDSPQESSEAQPTEKGKRKRGAEDDVQDDGPSKKTKIIRFVETNPFEGQEKLGDEEEMLLQLAGAYEEEFMESVPKRNDAQISLAKALFSVSESLLTTPPATPVVPSMPVDKGKDNAIEKRKQNTDTLEPETSANKSTQRASSVEHTPAETTEEVEKSVVQETSVEKVVEKKVVSAPTPIQAKPYFTTRAGRNIFIDDNYDDDDEDEEL
ncbi:hypothetical protein Ptr902_00816 [Pyrenophora tritici-repentis]|nr:hypothetical protein Ptr902_14114 [Pyrenophora tritici-repentis]KAI2486683.1 hypothetical protein Ptr902_00816 [Pyrenophora tritici-repentis]